MADNQGGVISSGPEILFTNVSEVIFNFVLITSIDLLLIKTNNFSLYFSVLVKITLETAGK